MPRARANRDALPMTATTATITPPRYFPPTQQTLGLLDFFAHHGIWAPGVRLFRKVNFTTKALLVSLAFLVPIVLLMGAYLKTVQESIDFASNERAGVTLLRAVEPWQIEVQKQRRMVISGVAATVDMLSLSCGSPGPYISVLLCVTWV